MVPTYFTARKVATVKALSRMAEMGMQQTKCVV